MVAEILPSKKAKCRQSIWGGTRPLPCEEILALVIVENTLMPVGFDPSIDMTRRSHSLLQQSTPQSNQVSLDGVNHLCAEIGFQPAGTHAIFDRRQSQRRVLNSGLPVADSTSGRWPSYNNCLSHAGVESPCMAAHSRCRRASGCASYRR